MNKEENPLERPANFATLSSAQLLGAVVDALGRRWGELADRQASRFFAGESVSPERRETYIRAFSQQLIEQGIIPDALIRQLPAGDEIDVIAGVIRWHASRWDQLGAYVYARAARISDPKLAISHYLRLVIIDLSIRVVAASWLIGAKPPGDEVPAWADRDGLGSYLNELRKSAGITRDTFADGAGVTRTGADNWLGSDPSRPSDENLVRIAQALGPGLRQDPTELLGSLRRLYLLQALAEKLEPVIGREMIEFFGQSMNVIVNELLDLHRSAFPEPGDESWTNRPEKLERAVGLAMSTITLGSSSPYARLFLETMAEGIEDFEWNLAARAVSLDWSIYLETQRIRDGSSSIAGENPDQSGGYDAVQDALTEESVKTIDALFRWDLIGALRHMARGLQVSEAALETSPGDAWLHFHVGSVVGKFKDPDRGIAECWNAAGLEPNWELPLVEIGIILVNAGRVEEARAHMEDIYQRRSEPTWHLLYTLGETRERCDDYEAAVDAYEQGLAMNPSHAVMMDRAAHCAFTFGDKSTGSRFAKQAHTLGSSETYWKWRRGEYRKRKRR